MNWSKLQIVLAGVTLAAQLLALGFVLGLFASMLMDYATGNAPSQIAAESLKRAQEAAADVQRAKVTNDEINRQIRDLERRMGVR